MKKLCFCFIGLLGLCGCDKLTNSITCDKYTVEIQKNADSDTLNIVINGDSVTLNHDISASGARYTGILNDTNIELWNKGADWTLTLDEELPISCK